MSTFGRTERGASYTGQPDTKCLLSREKESEGKLTFCWLQRGNMYTILSLTLEFHTELASQCVIVPLRQPSGAMFKHVPSPWVSFLHNNNNNKQPKYHHHPFCNTLWSQWDGQMLAKAAPSQDLCYVCGSEYKLTTHAVHMWQDTPSTQKCLFKV